MISLMNLTVDVEELMI